MNNPFLNYKAEESPPQSARSYRESLMNKFIDKILIDRTGTKYYPDTERKMRHFKQGVAVLINENPFLRESWQLEGFYKQCERAKVFSACFYGSLKIK